MINIDTTNMGSHLQRKLFEKDPILFRVQGFFFDSLWKRPRLIIPHQLVHFLHQLIASEVLVYDDAVLSDEE